jgi:hypothetical protein
VHASVQVRPRRPDQVKHESSQHATTPICPE